MAQIPRSSLTVKELSLYFRLDKAPDQRVSHNATSFFFVKLKMITLLSL